MGWSASQSGAGQGMAGEGAPPSQIGLPGWPHFSVARDQRSCAVFGRHLTPGRTRVAQYLASLSALVWLVFPGWYFWRFQNIPLAAWEDVKIVGAHLGSFCMKYTQWPDQQKWVFVGLYVVWWMATRLWSRLFFRGYCKLLVKQSAVWFTVDQVRLGRFGRNYARTPEAKISFSAMPHPRLPWLRLKAQRRGSSDLAVFYEEIRILVMEYGQTSVPVIYFAVPEDAERFSAVCRFANQYPLKKPADHTAQTESQDDGDV